MSMKKNLKWTAIRAVVMVGLLSSFAPGSAANAAATNAAAANATAMGNADVSARVADQQTYLVLCYHSIPARFNRDEGAISAPNFADQLAWLRDRGYTALSMNDVLEAKAGGKPLPKLSYLVTVDDGYEDFYLNAYPILKLYNVPAVFGLVGSWIENGPDREQSMGDPFYAQQHFVTWPQVKEMADSGLVEMASHSYDLHHGIIANPQKNTEPAAVTLQYDLEKKQYETLANRRLRVLTDLQKNSALIEKNTGKRPRIMIWPYGATDRIAAEAAAAAGMPINFTLSEGLASAKSTNSVPRTLIGGEVTLDNFSYMVQYKNSLKGGDPIRAIKINLDGIYDPDPERQNDKLGRVLNQIARLGVNTVLLQPYVTPAKDGSIEEVYFPNVYLPMRADLLNRVSWQLRSRLGVDVLMIVNTSNIAQRENGNTRHLDFSIPQDREKLFNIYSDLSLTVPSQGVIFEGARTDDQQKIFNKELLNHMHYYELPTLYYALDDNIKAEDDAEELYAGAPNNNFAGALIDAPVANSDAKQLQAFAKNLPPNKINILSFSVKDASIKELEKIADNIQYLKHQGLADFVIDGAEFLDDPSKLNILRQAISLKSNPLVTPGQ
ncbi:poly-beta-1,6-N-acetyl-D-glucosamine N-deacetylase PgaB [Glaciimonas immobilis]|uniref:Poly-beta-1,6-N-acetyl-D-glucosamine N-deacetylase PgaB n=1 Tax=Glaciimonas immobilis TaxID=728004 RepID=A0A840RXX9_9BURK|nr:poly-beta-1,6-N-acetyl-D-glucosamine N-deacetylase PgaB [Glaciimonas immobilis]KAF3996131.1 poly-beta-1,6-N-acetyl-D-glucosamine N-deacetylase PgaB [Glaciimonas immobilis]MBB5201716.1 poly-beta-1,6-N-acetyl-D-glucosamine N-deacetylase PgaB [Glaciimonas immobilis]